ncbi:family 20 glycosylhydrolase [Luteibacter sp. PPL554]
MIRAALACLAVVAATTVAAATPGVPAWALLPKPVVARQASTGAVDVDNGATLTVRGTASPAVRAVAEQLLQRIAERRGLTLRIGTAADARSAITFDVRADAAVEGDAGYRITVDGQGIVVTARSAQGAFYGGVTVWQLLTPAGWARGSAAHVPYGTIEDHPRFAWRALLLDSSRHVQTAAEIRQLIDAMSLDKLNVLVWHLTDDQGWRLPIPGYPELTTLGACRRAVGVDVERTGSPDAPYCGSYTADEVRDIVRYAAERYVTVVPEIDLPGHSQAAIAAYPWLGVTGKRPEVWTDWGVSPWLLNPNARTLRFVDAVMDEVMRLFPSRYVSIGGDEADKQQWNASAVVQAQKASLKLATMDELQGWFMQRVATYLTEHGRTPVGWDDQIAAGATLPRNQVVMSWHGDHDERVALAALKQGHDVVMTPQESLYFDHVPSSLPDEWPGPPPEVTLEQAYATQVIPPGADAAQAHHVIGVQAGLWTEQMATFAHDQHAVFPRIAALAELGWSPSDTHDWADFLRRLPAEVARYRALALDGADTAFAPVFDVTPIGAGGFRVTLANQVRAFAIRYTLDGSAPGEASPRYDQPLSLPDGTTLRAATFSPEGVTLSAARTQVLDATTTLSRDGAALSTCSGQPPSRLQGRRSGTGDSPVYAVDIGNACWRWNDAALQGATHVTITAERLAWRFGDEARGAVVRPDQGRVDAIEIHANACDGPRLATVALADAPAAGGAIRRDAAFAPLGADVHALCVFATGDPRQGQWALGRIAFSK